LVDETADEPFARPRRSHADAVETRVHSESTTPRSADAVEPARDRFDRGVPGEIDLQGCH
jgi:hypothetical protein